MNKELWLDLFVYLVLIFLSFFIALIGSYLIVICMIIYIYHTLKRCGIDEKKNIIN